MTVQYDRSVDVVPMGPQAQVHSRPPYNQLEPQLPNTAVICTLIANMAKPTAGMLLNVSVDAAIVS